MSNAIIAENYRANQPLTDQRSPFLVFRLSWFAHLRELWSLVVRVFTCATIAVLISLALDRFAHLHTATWLPGLGIVAAVAWTGYSMMLTNSVRLFTNENGVWIQSGIFPWQRGISGVQWRDLGQAGYTQGFASWALRWSMRMKGLAPWSSRALRVSRLWSKSSVRISCATAGSTEISSERSSSEIPQLANASTKSHTLSSATGWRRELRRRCRRKAQSSRTYR